MSECKFAVEAFRAYIESIGLSRPAGTLGELKAFKAGADWQRSLAQAELVALKAKTAVPEKYKMQPYQTVDKGSTNYKAGWNAGINAMLAAAPAQPQSEAKAAVPDMFWDADDAEGSYAGDEQSFFEQCADNISPSDGKVIFSVLLASSLPTAEVKVWVTHTDEDDREVHWEYVAAAPAQPQNREEPTNDA